MIIAITHKLCDKFISAELNTKKKKDGKINPTLPSQCFGARIDTDCAGNSHGSNLRNLKQRQRQRQRQRQVALYVSIFAGIPLTPASPTE